MDPSLLTFVNICILLLIFGSFAPITDSQPVFTPPPPPWSAPPPPPPWSAPPPPPPWSAPPPPPPWSSPPPPPPPPPPSQPPPPWSAPPTPPPPEFSQPPAPSPPEQLGETPPRPAVEARKSNIGKTIGWGFLGVAIAMQVFVAIFLIFKRKQLFKPDNVC